MKHCINIRSKEFVALTEQSGLHPMTLAAKMGVWMDENNTEDWPTINDLNIDNNSINFALKAADILMSDKAIQVFAKGEKNNWSLDKILTELSIPKEQKQLLLDLGISDKDEMAIELQSRYWYGVNVDTSRKSSPNSEYFSVYERDGRYFEESPYDGAIEINKETFDEYWRLKNTSYYSNLTVPGGINYRELEISTPNITPSIKGHAQFSTDKGIGWARVDDATVDELKGDWIKNESELPNEFIYNGERYFKQDGEWQTKSNFIDDIETVIWRYNMSLGNERTQDRPDKKALRVLELQSDLFQKGRGEIDIVKSEKNKSSNLNNVDFENSTHAYIRKNNEYIILNKTDNSITKVDKDRYDQVLEMNGVYYNNRVNELNTQNQFLQLLNKDNNWVTFFIKSIIQDSAKKGYEKILFPKGETAAKIEGHETIADEIEKIDRRIADAPKITKFKISNSSGYFELFDTKDDALREIENRKFPLPIEGENIAGETFSLDGEVLVPDLKIIEELERQKQNLKSQGIEKLKPIEAFYEIKVGNILEKQFGKDNVKTITDEYGNGWYQIDLSNEKVKQSTSNILLQKKGRPSEKKVLSLSDIYNRNISKLNKSIENAKLHHSEEMTMNEYLSLRHKYNDNENSRISIEKVIDYGHKTGTEDIIVSTVWVVKDSAKKEALEAAKKEYANLQKEPVQLSLFDITDAVNSGEISITSSDDSKTYFEHPLSQLKSFFDKLVNPKTKVSKNVSNQAKSTILAIAKSLSDRTGIQFKIISQEEAVKMGAKDASGFYNRDNMTAYLVDGEYSGSTTIHEIFGHAFLDDIKNSNKDLYDLLLSESMAIPGLRESVELDYKDKPLDHDDETILRALDLITEKKITELSNPKQYSIFSKFFDYVANFINNILGKSSNDIKSIKPFASLEDLANWAIYGENKIKLSDNINQSNEIEDAIEHLYESNRDDLSDFNGKTIEQLLESDKVSETAREWLSEWFYENNPATLSDFIKGVSEDLQKGKSSFNKFSSKDISMQKSKSTLNDMISYKNDIIKGLSARVRAIQRSKEKNQSVVDELNNLIIDINKANEAEGLVKFVLHAFDKVLKVEETLDEMNKNLDAGVKINSSTLLSINTDFLRMFSDSIENIRKIKDSSDFKSLPISITNKEFEESLSQVLTLFDNTKRTFGDVFEKQLKLVSLGEGELSGDPEIDSLIADIYKSDSDVSWISTFIGGPRRSRSQRIRMLANKIKSVKVEVSREVSNSGHIQDLVRLAKKATNSFYTSFTNFYEKDSKGKYTGYLVHKLKYGEFYANYNKFRDSLASKYGLDSYRDYPVDPTDFVNYNTELNDWLSDHADRMFTPEYYKLRSKLSIHAVEALDEANREIRRIRKKYMTSDGLSVSIDIMTPKDKASLQRAERMKKDISSEYNEDGSIKTGIRLEVAQELKAFNKALSENLKYQKNLSAFKKAMIEAKDKYSPEEFARWMKDNTRTEYDQKFWDALSKIDKAFQLPEWQDLYDARQSIVNRFRNQDTMEIDVDQLENTKYKGKSLRSIVDEMTETLDKYKSENWENKKPSEKGQTFGDVAEMIWSDSYKKKLISINKMMNGTDAEKAYAENWYASNHSVNQKGEYVPKFYWMKMIPKDKSLILKDQPNNRWSVVDKDSAYYNNNYDETLEEYGMQPKADRYDNSKEYEKLISDPNRKALYDKLIEMLKISNNDYDYLNKPSALRLPQISGGSLRLLTRTRGFGKGIAAFIKNAFVVRADESEFGGSVEDQYRPDGSIIKHVPTFFKKMLDDPNTISKDLINMMAQHYHASTNYRLMSEALPDIQILKEGIKNTAITGRKQKQAGSTNMASLAEGIVDRDVFGETHSSLTITSKRLGISIDAAKPIKQLINYFKLVGLSFNPMVIASNYGSATISLLVESVVGTTINKKDLARAYSESIIRYPYYLYNILNERYNDKISGLCRYYDIAKNEVADTKMSNGISALNFAKEHWAFGPYSAGDFLIKSRMLSALLMGYKLHNGKFYNRGQFVREFYNGDWKSGIRFFNKLKTNLYDSFEMKNGKLSIKDNAKDAYTPEIHSIIYNISNGLAARLDGVLTDSDRNKINVNAFGSALMMYRGWLVTAVQDRFAPKSYDYETRKEFEGQYVAASKSFVNLMTKVLTLRLKEASDYVNKAPEYERTAAKRSLHELAALASVGMVAAALGSMAADDEDDEGALYYAYVSLLRLFMELGSVWSPGDTLGILKSPTAMQGPIDDGKMLLDDIASGKWDDEMQRGKWEGFPRWQRYLLRMTPYKNVQEKIISPDLKSTERYLKKNSMMFTPFESIFKAEEPEEEDEY